nr:MAG TPA: hypothetical protein [Bacteriophage sp.]
MSRNLVYMLIMEIMLIFIQEINRMRVIQPQFE